MKPGTVAVEAALRLVVDEAAPLEVALWSPFAPLDVFVACAEPLSVAALTPVLLIHC